MTTTMQTAEISYPLANEDLVKVYEIINQYRAGKSREQLCDYVSDRFHGWSNSDAALDLLLVVLGQVSPFSLMQARDVITKGLEATNATENTKKDFAMLLEGLMALTGEGDN